MYRTTPHLGPLLGIALLAASPAPAALVHYELTLTTSAPYTAFGGGAIGDIFTGTFDFDDSWPTVSWPPHHILRLLPDAAIVLVDIDINGTRFSTATPGATHDNALLFPGLPIDGSALLDVFFDITNPNGDRLQVFTSGAEADWIATESGSSPGPKLPLSVQFTQIQVPEPSAWALGVLGTLSLLFHRRRTLH